MSRIAVTRTARPGLGAIEEHHGPTFARESVRHRGANDACTNDRY
jgi:hypothetical protein